MLTSCPATGSFRVLARASAALGLIACAAAAAAAPALRPPPSAAPDLVTDLRAMAQQRPWRCELAPARPVPRTGWTATAPECAWQNRLRMQSWSGPGLAPGSSCISAPAAWWYWSRGPHAVPVWQSSWTANSLRDDSATIKRIVLVRELPRGRWTVTEWRWAPSPRAATRAWQLGRWNALAARAAQFSQAADGGKVGVARMLGEVLEANLGMRPAEQAGDVLKWQTDGLCLKVDAAAPGAQQLQLPYSADDSRLEQRAAMQVQLARRYPHATWLSTFNLVPTPRQVRSGAKFYAVWIEGTSIKGQLWMPTRGDGPLVRVRIVTDLAAVPAAAGEDPAVMLRKQVIERELMNVAARWASAYE